MIVGHVLGLRTGNIRGIGSTVVGVRTIVWSSANSDRVWHKLPVSGGVTSISLAFGSRHTTCKIAMKYSPGNSANCHPQALPPPSLLILARTFLAHCAICAVGSGLMGTYSGRCPTSPNDISRINGSDLLGVLTMIFMMVLSIGFLLVNQLFRAFDFFAHCLGQLERTAVTLVLFAIPWLFCRRQASADGSLPSRGIGE